MAVNLPGMNGGKQEEGHKGGDNKSMDNNNNNKGGKKGPVVSKEIIKNSDHTLAFTLMGLLWSELWKRPFETIIIGLGTSAFLYVGYSFSLGSGAALVDAELPNNVGLSTQVGYISTTVIKNTAIGGGEVVLPAAGSLANVVLSETGRAGEALVVTALTHESINRTQNVVDYQRPNNLLLVNYTSGSYNRTAPRLRGSGVTPTSYTYRGKRGASRLVKIPTR